MKLCKRSACDNPVVGRKHKQFCCRICKDIQARQKAKRWRQKKRPKDTYCKVCGPEIAYHYCQLDVDHIDGNRDNNDPLNLQTLCANCHRLKTFVNKDYSQ